MFAVLVVWLQQTNMQHVMYPPAIRQLDLVCHLIDHFDYGEWTHPLYQQLLCAYSASRYMLRRQHLLMHLERYVKPMPI